MAIVLDDSVYTAQGKAQDAKYDNDGQGWTSVTHVNQTILVPARSLRLTVDINGVEYWYRYGTADEDLIVKNASSLVVQTDKFLTSGLYTIVNEPTLVRYIFQSTSGSNYSWLINEVVYYNILTEVEVLFAAVGYKRRDMFYVDASNGIKIRTGTEVLVSEQVVTPLLNTGELFIGFIEVTDSETTLPPSINTEDFIRRSFLETFAVKIVDNYIDTPLATGGQANFKIYGTASDVKGLKTETTDPIFRIYDGKIYVLTNLTGSDVLLKHNDSTEVLANTKLLLPENVDLVFPSNNKITLIANIDNNLEFVSKSWEVTVGEIFTTTLKTAYNNAVTWISTNGSALLNHLSSIANAHPISAITGLETALNEKLETVNTSNIEDGAVTNDKFRNSTAHTVVGRAGSGNGSVADIGLPNNTILGRQGSGSVEGLSVSQVQDMLGFGNNKQNVAVYTTIDVTSVLNNDRFIAKGTLTISDISNPVAGSNYEVVVRGGFVTVGGVVYQQGNIIQRIHDGTSWATIVLNQFNVLTVTSSVDITTSVEWDNKIITIDNGANNITITTNHNLTLAGNKNGGIGIVTFANGTVTNVLANGIATMTGIYDTFSIIPKVGSSDNLLYISRQ